MMLSRLHTSGTATETQLVGKYVTIRYFYYRELSQQGIQRALYNLGLTGIPITNVNNACSTGSTALYQANNLVKAGLVECALALGFERMSPGSLKSNFPDRPAPGLLLGEAVSEAEQLLTSGANHGPGAPRMFANAGQEHFDKFGSTIEHLAKIGMFTISYVMSDFSHF